MRWTRFVAAFVLLVVGASTFAQAPPVRVDERIELLTIVARLSGAREYTMPNSKSRYAERVERRFGLFREHPAILAYKAIRAKHGASYDAIPSLALHLDAVPSLVERMPFEPRPARLDARWEPEATRDFLVKLRDFASATNAAEFFATERPFYERVELRLGEFVAGADAVSWFDAFFGAKAATSYVVIPGLLCGGGNYGSGVVFPANDPQGRAEEIRPVLGCWQWDDEGVPRFDEASYLPTYVHELCHSYTNPIVDRHFAEFEPAANRIFKLVAPQMKRMAYGNAKTMTYESLVRACVVRYLAARKGEDPAKKEIERQTASGFAWVGDLAALLERYAADRARYPTLDAFMPQVAVFFGERAEQMERAAAANNTRAPRLVSMTPANGAEDVAPDVGELRLVFDRPMHPRGWSFMGSKDDIPEFVSEPSYQDGGKELVVKVRLVPGKTYRFGLNSPTVTGFAAADGTPLEPVEVTFSVKKP